jgi:hypothetical protein
MPLLGASNMQSPGSTQTISPRQNFVRPRPRHPLNRPGTLWLDEHAKENSPYLPGIRSNQPSIDPRSYLSSKNNRGIIPQPEDYSHRPPRTALGDVVNSSASPGLHVSLGHSSRKSDTVKAAEKPGMPRSRSALSELAEFLKSTGPEDFARRGPRLDTPGGSMGFVDVPVNEEKSTSKALVDSTNRESSANRKKNTGRWLRKAVGVLWGSSNKDEFKEELA